ncbi:hypothetical protein TI05_09880 [Achromatium sp. WMS3]|nr:hypothetical protein TI05_09880 [Achromatium sp. WMS3]
MPIMFTWISGYIRRSLDATCSACHIAKVDFLVAIHKVGMIINSQGNNLKDYNFLRSYGVSVWAIPILQH